jgi:dipeptidyl aminopeptidase/acylaminoacyl peptidase
MIRNPAVSPTGDFIFYYLEYPPKWRNALVIQSLKTEWKLEIPPDVIVGSAQFTDDGNQLVFKKNDSIGIVFTHSGRIEYITGITDYKVRPDKAALLGFVSSSKLIIRNLETAVQQSYETVRDYLFDPAGTHHVILTTESRDSTHASELVWVDVQTGQSQSIWQGGHVINVIIDAAGKQIAFCVENKQSQLTSKSYWLYDFNKKEKFLLSDFHSPTLDSNYLLDKMTAFSLDGKRLFLYIKKKDDSPAPKDALKLDVWNFKDTKLQSQQLKEPPKKIFQAAINLKDRRLIRLENNFDMLQPSRKYFDNNNIAVLYHRKADIDPFEFNWQPGSEQSVVLVNYNDGSRRTILTLTDHQKIVSISTEGCYILYYDGNEKNFYTYSFIDGITRNITRGIPANWSTPYRNDKPDVKFIPRGMACWLPGDSAVLIYDRNDIWRIDPIARKAPINLTNGYGHVHNIMFNLSVQDYTANAGQCALILSAFNESNKENGYYLARSDRRSNPQLLSMGPYLFELTNNPYILSGADFSPLKAPQQNSYIVQRMSEKEYPNLFTTADFVTFKPLSSLHPEHGYNWLTTELITWKSSDGQSIQGVLYKPANFDPQKKYPIILNYYERKSQDLHVFIRPESYGDLCIPLFVSNGYLVFAPDISYTIGQPAKSVVNSVLSAANMLKKFSFIDSKRIAIQGFSFGAVETNFLVTRLNIFAAACSASGISDFISGYDGLTKGGTSLQYMYETHQMRMGSTLWKRPDLYIENSAIFKANKVTTPLLIMHNKNDFICPFSNAVEFFTALRRLQKRAWMLQYDDCRHGVEGKSAIDFVIRTKQFFDHYLKSAPAPVWMTQGIPARLKGIETGYAYDPAGNCGKDCKVCKMWNEKMKKDSAGTWKEIEEKTKSEHWMGEEGRNLE